MTDSHVELPGSRRPMAHGARRVRDLDPHTHVEVTLTLKAPPLPPSDKLPETALSAAELAQHYGASAHDIRKVEDVLRSFGLRVESVGTSGRSMRVSGTAHAIEAAFRSGLAIYHNAEQGEFRGREGAVSVPAEISGLVHSVLGLDQRRMARRGAAKASVAAATAPLRPGDLEERYNFPPGDAARQSIGIAEFGIPQHSGTVVAPAYFPDDVAAFCKAQGRAMPQVRPVAVNLAPLTLAQYHALPNAVAKQVLGETSEVMMDVEIIAALCSAADISVYFAGWDQKGWVDLLEKIIADRPVVLSISYGLAEDSPHWAEAALQAINETLQIAAMAGITVCVSSGDDGSGCDMPDTRAHVEFPGSSPFVLSVGGTMLSGHGAAQSEIAWWEAPGQRLASRGGATGGGVSAVFNRPAWQTENLASLNHGSIAGRIVPDVAALAGPPFYELTLLGHSSPAGGTSAATPVWASLIARIDAALPLAKRQRFRAPMLYHKAHSGGTIGGACCTDITSGHNASHPQPGKGYVAGRGYDAVTGWGVPNGRALLDALK
jgi:kumamolisin